MPNTRNDESTKALIKEVFTEIKDELLSAFQEGIMKKLEAHVTNVVDGKVKVLATKFEEKLTKLESTVEMLQKQVSELKQQNNLLSKERKKTDEVLTKCDDLEQYGRRLCLRINGVKTEQRETPGDVLKKVKDVISANNLDIPDANIDRAHRIGPKTVEEGEEKRQIIVRFTTFRHRTKFYKARKTFSGIRVSLDLTKRRYALLKAARRAVEGNVRVKFVYADVNCRLKCRLSDDTEIAFETLDDLDIELAS